MKQVLFEEDGGFRVGTILSEAGAAFQVEAAHGKRSKVKANAVLLRFDGQSLGGFMPEAQSRAQALDPQFLWEVCGSGEFGFAELAQDYYGHPPAPLEATAVALCPARQPDVLLPARKGPLPGRARGEPQGGARGAGEEAPPAGAGRRVGRADRRGHAPARARGQARPPALQAGQDVARVARPRPGGHRGRGSRRRSSWPGSAPSPGPEDYFLRRFAFEFFPEGLGFPEVAPVAAPQGLPLAPAAAFSIDDHETTEIDDAFSVERLPDGRLRVGVHIAAPALFFGRDHRAGGDRAGAPVHGLLPRRQDHHAARGGHRRGHALGGARGGRGLALPRPRPGHARHHGLGVAPRARAHRHEPAHRRARDAPARGVAGGRTRRGRAWRGPRAALEARVQAAGRARGGRGEEREARLHLPRGSRPRDDRAAAPRHAHRRAGLRAHDPRERDLGARARRCVHPRHLPQPARHQDAHGGGAGVARVAGRLPLRVVQLAAAALHRPRQPAPAGGAASGRGGRLFARRAGRRRARFRDGLRGLRRAPAPPRALLVPALDRAGRAGGGRRRPSCATSWCAWMASRSSAGPSGCRRAPPGTGCAWPSASPTRGR